jgi:hypothetical protein
LVFRLKPYYFFLVKNQTAAPIIASNATPPAAMPTIALTGKPSGSESQISQPSSLQYVQFGVVVDGSQISQPSSLQ